MKGRRSLRGTKSTKGMMVRMWLLWFNWSMVSGGLGPGSGRLMLPDVQGLP